MPALRRGSVSRNGKAIRPARTNESHHSAIPDRGGEGGDHGDHTTETNGDQRLSSPIGFGLFSASPNLRVGAWLGMTWEDLFLMLTEGECLARARSAHAPSDLYSLQRGCP